MIVNLYSTDYKFHPVNGKDFAENLLKSNITLFMHSHTSSANDLLPSYLEKVKYFTILCSVVSSVVNL